jgi:DNA-binding transcriptional LysR family regulator
VSKGFGVAVVPASLKRAALAANVKFIPLQDAQTHTSGHFIWNPDALSPPLENLIRLIP